MVKRIYVIDNEKFSVTVLTKNNELIIQVIEDLKHKRFSKVRSEVRVLKETNNKELIRQLNLLGGIVKARNCEKLIENVIKMVDISRALDVINVKDNYSHGNVNCNIC